MRVILPDSGLKPKTACHHVVFGYIESATFDFVAEIAPIISVIEGICILTACQLACVIVLPGLIFRIRFVAKTQFRLLFEIENCSGIGCYDLWNWLLKQRPISSGVC